MVANREPVTGHTFIGVIDLGEVNEAALAAVQRAGSMSVVTGMFQDNTRGADPVIKYDIVPSAMLLQYVQQCQTGGRQVFNLSAYPAGNIKDAKVKMAQLDGSTTGAHFHAFQSGRLWRRK